MTEKRHKTGVRRSNIKVCTNKSKVKGLGSPLRAEPSGRCCRRYGHSYISILYCPYHAKETPPGGKY